VKYLVLVLVSLARIARADDAGYATLDRQDRATKLGAELMYFSIPHGGQWTRLDLAAQLVHPSTGLGLYAQMPFAYESDSSANQIFALGGLELGGLVATRAGVVLHAGIVLPTGSAGDNANVIGTTLAARPSDLIQALPNTTSIRAGIAYEFRADELFGRIELGVDATLIVDDSTGSVPSDSWLHLNGALGFDAGDLTLAVETSNAFSLGSAGSTFDVIAAAIRLRAGCARPYLAAVVPLDAQPNEPRVAFVAGIEQRF